MSWETLTAHFVSLVVMSLPTKDTLFPLTFLLAPPSETLGLVLKSPSKLNIIRSFPWTDSEDVTGV